MEKYFAWKLLTIKYDIIIYAFFFQLRENDARIGIRKQEFKLSRSTFWGLCYLA